MRWKGRAGRWVHTVWSEITVSSLYHLLAAIALPGSHSFNERIYSPWKNLFCVSLMCNIKKKKKKSPKYWLSEVIGIHVAAISYWQSHKKAEICQANPVCALLRGPHSSVAGHVDNNKKKKKKNCIFRSGLRFVAFHLMCNHKQVCPGERLGRLSGTEVWGLYISLSLHAPCNIKAQVLFICPDKEVCLF